MELAMGAPMEFRSLYCTLILVNMHLNATQVAIQYDSIGDESYLSLTPDQEDVSSNPLCGMNSEL